MQGHKKKVFMKSLLKALNKFVLILIKDFFLNLKVETFNHE